MIELQRSSRQISIREQLAQRRRDMNATTETLDQTNIMSDCSMSKSQSLSNSNLMSSMIERRQQRQKMLNQSMGKLEPMDMTIEPADKSTSSPALKPATLGSSANLSTSIRERLKDRVKKSQDTAIQDEPVRKLRGLRNREHQTRFDVDSETTSDPKVIDDIQADDDQDGDQSHKSPKTSVRWKLLAKKGSLIGEDEPEIDQFSFFTKVYEDTKPSKSKPTLSDVDDTNFAHFDSVYVLSKPVITERNSDDKLFVPSKLTPEVVTLHGGEPCYLEDEGIYVGEPPGVSGHNWNRMENRLIQSESGKKWFGINGEMIVTPDPLKQISSRPLINFDEVDNSIQINAKCVTSTHTGVIIGDRNVHQLSVSISHILFAHHPLFSREHVLVSQLKDLYTQYLNRHRHNLASHLEDRLQSLRDAVIELKYTLGPAPYDMSKPFNQDCVANLNDYSEEIRNVREMVDLECMKDKQMLKSILTIWKELKVLRETQGYISTNAKLLIYKEEVDFKREDKKWQQMVKATYEERKTELMAISDQKQRQYQNDLSEWKLKSKENKKKMKDSKTTGDNLELEMLPPKPLAPQKPQLKDLLNEIQSNAAKCRKVPGDPIIKLELTHTVPVTPIEECPVIEQKRRKDLQKAVYYGKLYYNKNEVTKTTNMNLTSEFMINFNESIVLQVVHWPESIRFELWDTSEKISDILLPIPPNDRHSGNAQLEIVDFSSSHKVSFANSSAVGSGVAESTESKILLTTGKLMGSAAWVKDENGKILAPTRKDAAATFGRADPVHAIGAKSLNDMNKVLQWVSEARLDPNDPRNAPLLDLISRSNKDAVSDVKYFRLNHLEKQTYFSTSEEIENDKRFQLLSLRNQGAPEYKPMKMVPMYSSEVTGFQHAISEKEAKPTLKEEGDVFEQHRTAVTKYLKDVQERIASRSRKVKVVHELADVVVEEQVPDISTLGRSIAKILEPRHPLRPQRKERKKVTNQAVGISSVDLLVNISQAQCLPVRRRTVTSGQSVGGAVTTVTLRPFVEVTFQRKSCLTHVGDGPNPHWNQELVLPLNVVNNEYSVNNLREITDIVYFNVFDEIIVDILDDDRLRDTNIHHRLERRWLGCLQIPFSTIYLNSRIEGKFKLNVPTILMGYNREHGPQPQILPDLTGLSLNPVLPDKNSYLSIFITVEPPLAPQAPLREIFDSNEEMRLIRASAIWENDLKQSHPTRNVKNLVTDVNGKSVFITRFITPQNPPTELIPEDRVSRMTLPVMQRVAKFVSLIPYYHDSIAFSGSCDIWITSDLFLKMLAGDEEEHAILLCNYFLYMGIEAYVVVGVGVPEGETCYVLTKLPDGCFLWNPSTGDCHPQTRPYQSLITVSYVFNHENVWANIQQYEDPGRILFNMKDTRLWKPFMTKNVSQLSSVQVSTLDYIKTNHEAISILENNLEKMLMDKIMEWRDRHVTRWNRHCRVIMKQLLPKLEFGELSEEEQQNAMLDLMKSHHVTGFPINMRYSDVNTIIETVYSTNVHVAEDVRVEFAMSVYIHPYPNNVLSVWIYVGTLTNKY